MTVPLPHALYKVQIRVWTWTGTIRALVNPDIQELFVAKVGKHHVASSHTLLDTCREHS